MSGDKGTASQGSSRKKRGPASVKNFMRDVALQPGGKYTLEVDPLTNTISGKFKSKLSTYTSLLVKSKLSILTLGKDVDKQTKTLMWKDVLMHFVFPGDEEKMMNVWLTQASTLFRGWKSHLNTDYVDQGKSPYVDYPFISQEDWETYVRLVKTPEYEAKRKKFKDTSSKNLYPHRVSRGGYDYIRKKLRQKWEEQQQASVDGGAHDDVPLDLSRPTVWTLARTDKKTGLITHEPTLQVVERIGTLVEEANQGIFTPDNPRNDILTVTLGTPEHRGRVRTAGHGVGHKDYFGGCYRPRKETRAHLSSEDLEEVANRVRNELRGEITVEVREELMRTERARITTEDRKELRAEITTEVRNQFTSEMAEIKRLFYQHQQQQQSLPQIEKASKQRAIDSPAKEDVIVVDWVALGREMAENEIANWRLPVSTMDDASITID